MLLRIDPLGRPTVVVGSDHYFQTCCPYVVPKFQHQAKITACLDWTGRVDHWWLLLLYIGPCFSTGIFPLSLFFILLIHSADPQSQSVVIFYFTHVVRPSPHSNFAIQDKFQVKIMLWVWPRGSLMTPNVVLSSFSFLLSTLFSLLNFFSSWIHRPHSNFWKLTKYVRQKYGPNSNLIIFPDESRIFWRRFMCIHIHVLIFGERIQKTWQGSSMIHNAQPST